MRASRPASRAVACASLPSRRCAAAKVPNIPDLVCIGCGSSCEECRLEEALRLASSGLVDYLVFDRLSEWVEGHHHLQRHRTGQPIFDSDLRRYLETLLPTAVASGVRLITNGGAPDPEAALEVARDVAELLSLNITAAAPRTDRLLDVIREINPVLLETGEPLSELDATPVGASVYRGGRMVAEGLDRGANLVITNRVGDSALYLGALVHAHGWEWDDWVTLARGMAVGHMLECGPQVTGGYFAAPPYKIVPEIARLGLPYAEVEPGGNAVVTKLAETGGLVTVRTCTEQLLYEVGDPSCYIHDDVVVDWTTTTLEEVGPDRIRMSGTSGHPRTPLSKALISVPFGFMAEAYILLSGSDAAARADLSAEIVRDRTLTCGLEPLELRLAFIGLNSTCATWTDQTAPIRELMVHVAARFATRQEAELFTIDPSGPVRAASDCYGAAGSIRARSLAPQIAEVATVFTALLPRERIPDPELVVLHTDPLAR